MVAVKRITWGDWIQSTHVISYPHCYGLIGSAVFRMTHKDDDIYFLERLDKETLESAHLTVPDAKEFAQKQIEEELREIIRFPDEKDAPPRAKTYRAKFQPEAMFYAGNGDHGPIIDWLLACGVSFAGVKPGHAGHVIVFGSTALPDIAPPGYWILQRENRSIEVMCSENFNMTYEVADPLEALGADQQPLGEDIARIWDNNTGKLYEA